MVKIIISSILLIGFASACNAVMDVVDHKYSKSIFRKLKSKTWRLWFNEDRGWLNKYVDRDLEKGRRKLWVFNYPVQLTDAWHFCKMLMVISMCTCAVLTLYICPVQICEFRGLIGPIGVLISYGLAWNVTFRLFYDHLLISK